MNLPKTIFSFIVMLSSIQLSFSQSTTSSLPVVDLSKDYALEKLRLHDLATVEYVPLETTDDILLSENASLSAVTDNYILIYEFQLGDVYLFDRHTGKLRHHFNNMGQSEKEYSWIKVGVILDEKNKEIFVCSQFFQVYDFDGNYKRTLKGINGFDHDMSVFNYDDECLLIFDDVLIEPNRERETTDRPYRLISKKDGSTVSKLNICFPKRVSKAVVQHMNNNIWRPFKISYTCNAQYGDDLMIMDASSDTLYHLSSNKDFLKPILTRTPSVFFSEPRNVWSPYMTTDKFMLFGTILLDFDSRYVKCSNWKYDFKTHKLTKVSIFDTELETRKYKIEWSPNSNPSIGKNMAAELIPAPIMIEVNKKKRLLGNGSEVARNLKDDDNQVVRILKFK